jgi:hypothetical protein
MARALSSVMPRDPKRDAQKTEDAGLTAPHEETPSVAGLDAPGEEGIEAAEEKARAEQRRKRQDSLDRERAAGEGMTAPPSER